MASPKSGFFQDGKDDNTSVSSTAYITAPSSDVFFKQQFNSYTKNREVADALDQLAKSFRQCLSMIDRLPTTPVFKAENAKGDDIPVKEGVFGAMGDKALGSLKIDIEPDEPSSSLGLGSSSNADDSDS